MLYVNTPAPISLSFANRHHSRYSKGMLSSEKTNSHMAIWCHVCVAQPHVTITVPHLPSS